MPHHKERPARKATSRLAIYLFFAFILACMGEHARLKPTAWWLSQAIP